MDAEINLASGAVDALERLLCALLLPGDSVAIEDPCFLSSINMLRYAGFHPSPVPVDGEGMQPEPLEEGCATAPGRSLSPARAQSDRCSLSESRARAIREILARYPQVSGDC
ncbi:transcriptional regulatory protein PtsJ [Klebsiella grimontii]|uniref:Transcriptional regulatory protein PtsJ n=1 Tax=Klebsiella grimontii TaxID=2058152 RepID=A0A7H4NZA4_9ENTR|nr:transcriptional regulatory protein PtsJ [Klebsiella grimontii]